MIESERSFAPDETLLECSPASVPAVCVRARPAQRKPSDSRRWVEWRHECHERRFRWQLGQRERPSRCTSWGRRNLWRHDLSSGATMLPQHRELRGAEPSRQRLSGTHAEARDLRRRDLPHRTDLLLARWELHRPVDRGDELPETERTVERRFPPERTAGQRFPRGCVVDRRFPPLRVQRRLPPDPVLLDGESSPLPGTGDLRITFELRLQFGNRAILRVRRGYLPGCSVGLPSRRFHAISLPVRHPSGSRRNAWQPAYSRDLLRNERPMSAGPAVLLHHRPLLRCEYPIPVYVTSSGDDDLLCG